MTKTFYAAKLNKSMNKYLAVTNINNVPTTASQDALDYAIFFETEDQAASAIEAYLNHPSCKMSKENRKFISVEPFEFEFVLTRFPFTNQFTIVDSSGLKDSTNFIFKGVTLEYGDFTGHVYICSKAYKELAIKSGKK